MFPDVRITTKLNVLWDKQNGFFFWCNLKDCPSNCLFSCANKPAVRDKLLKLNLDQIIGFTVSVSNGACRYWSWARVFVFPIFNNISLVSMFKTTSTCHKPRPSNSNDILYHQMNDLSSSGTRKLQRKHRPRFKLEVKYGEALLPDLSLT